MGELPNHSIKFHLEVSIRKRMNEHTFVLMNDDYILSVLQFHYPKIRSNIQTLVNHLFNKY